METYFTSESVSEGHPDKICDQISDALVDLYLRADPEAHLGIETVATTNYVGLLGEIKSTALISESLIEETVRKVVRDIGYEQEGFGWRMLKLENRLHAQSPDIAQGVEAHQNQDIGAGDQGIMFGYACSETPHLMPAAIFYAHQVLKVLADARHSGEMDFLGPDAKSQVTLKYADNIPIDIASLTVSTQHHPDITMEQLREKIYPLVIKIFPEEWTLKPDQFYINPTGRFVIGGPDGDAGLTGRKIIVDTYGGSAPHGGGAFSGKDPTKVDRSAAYMARYLAKNVVASGLSQECTIQLSYVIGMSQPISLYINLHGSHKINAETLRQYFLSHIDLTPSGIISRLGLRQPIYQRTAVYGHFGRAPGKDGGFSWEKLDLVKDLQKLL